MTIPRFTADTALGRARGRYRGATRAGGAPAGQVTGQMFEGDGQDTAMDGDAYGGGSEDDEDTSFEFDDDGE